MNKYKFLCSISVCALLSACAVGPKYNPSMIKTPKQGMAEIVLYHQNSINGIRGMPIEVAGKDCALLANGFLTTSVSPGATEIKISDDIYTIKTAPNQTYYIKMAANADKQRGASMAAGGFGLVGSLVYAAATHGDNTPDYIFKVVLSSTAKKQLAGLQQSAPCD